MPFDFSSIEKNKNTVISAGIPKIICLAGVRGSGKSSICGTLPQNMKTLLLQCNMESHSYISASGIAKQKYGNSNHLTPFELDKLNGVAITGDAVIGRLIELLNDEQLPKLYSVVVLDSLGAFDAHVQATTDVGNADKFSVTKVTIGLYQRIFNAVKKYVSRGGVFIYTLPLDVYNDDNGVAIATPKLRGSGAVTSILGETPIIAMTAVNTDVNEDGDSKREYVLSFDGTLSKSRQKIISMSGAGKDMKIKTVPMMQSCNCRITGLPASKIPSVMDADLEELLKLTTLA